MVRIAEVLTRLYSEILPVAERRGVKLDLDVADPTLVTDDGGVERLVEKLLEEALGRCERGDKITLGLARDEGQIEVTIRDTGKALSRAECAKMTTDAVELRSRYGYGTTVVIML